MQTNPAVEQSKIIRWSVMREISPVVLWRKGFAEEPSLEFGMKD